MIHEGTTYFNILVIELVLPCSKRINQVRPGGTLLESRHGYNTIQQNMNWNLLYISFIYKGDTDDEIINTVPLIKSGIVGLHLRPIFWREIA